MESCNKLTTMKIKIIFLLFTLAIFWGCGTTKKALEPDKTVPKYEPTWESLAQHNEEPNWFQDENWGSISIGEFILSLLFQMSGIQETCI